MRTTKDGTNADAGRHESEADAARIVSCDIGPYPKELGDPLPEVRATFDDGTVQTLFRFYPDELTFKPDEFIGRTADEAKRLHFEKDRAFLRS
jgi:hypothetical protein